MSLPINPAPASQPEGMPNNEKSSPRPRRSLRFQFSLRTLFIVVTVLCVGPLGYIAWERERRRKGEAAVSAIEKVGGKVKGDFPRRGNRNAWKEAVLGHDGFRRVYAVEFRKTQVTDAELMHLNVIKNLRSLSVTETGVTDAGLKHLAGLTNLKSLWLEQTQVTDAGIPRLTSLVKLEVLSLKKTRVTDASLIHLLELKGLAYLNLRQTGVTDAGVAELKKSLRNCVIEYDISSAAAPKRLTAVVR